MGRPQVFALTRPRRAAELRRKFGMAAQKLAQALGEVLAPSEQILGAVVFLARHQGDIPALVALANADRAALLDAATMKEERG